MATRTTVQITMPQMGESVTEGTILEWLKQVGDEVARDEGLVEVSTDKVDTEVPAPATGTLTKIVVQPDETVPVGTVLGEIETGGDGGGPVAAGNGGAPETPDRESRATAPDDGAATAEAAAQTGAGAGSAADTDADVVELEMPQMGESVSEGTILEWLKQVGDEVARDEAVVEVSTDKVDTEVPAPATGRIVEILVQPDETVSVGTPLCRIAVSAGAAAVAGDGASGGSAAPPAEAAAAPTDEKAEAPAADGDGHPPAAPRQDATPVAQRIAAAHGIDLASLSGSGPRGRVLKEDVLAAVQGNGAGTAPAGPSRHADEPQPRRSPIRGPAATAVRFMDQSRTLPTATSFRTIPVGVLDDRRRALKEGGNRLSFTHLIAWAIVCAASEMPVMTNSFEEEDGKPFRLDPGDVSLGLAVDVERRDGTRSLVVPVLRGGDRLAFGDFASRYDELVAGAHASEPPPDTYRGASITLTNPGGIGTVASVPRLMPGQGTIVATGSIAYPPGLAQADPGRLRELGVTKVMTMTSTYDHRVIQGAESGSFLARVDELLQGGDGFYQNVFSALGAQVEAAPSPAPQTAAEPVPARVEPAVEGAPEELLQAVQAATSIVKAHRMHGHLAARLDPLESEPLGDPALDPASVNLSQEQMRAIPASVLRVAVPGKTFADALPKLQQTYCGTIAYEIEHISDHNQRVWLRQAIESGAFSPALDAGRKRALLERLTEVEALETYLHRAFLGKKSFSIEGLDSLVPMLDETIEMASAEGAREVVLGMAHRGRLNVLAHIVGRSYQAILAEFEGEQNLEVQTALPEGGTGDVKYHHGAAGTYRTSGGKGINVTLAANPSHLEYVNPVVVGRARADQTSRKGREVHHDPSIVLPVLIHGDASFPGQGVVAETLNLSGLEGYSTGGTIHIITNNQLGFTTGPEQARSTRYASDLAKGYDVPIIHVNADDVEACVAAAWLAFAFRDRFKRDALIDLIGYRRYGHNETDEPAYTQPDMYERISHHPPARKLYAGRLVEARVVTEDEVEAMAGAAHKRLADAHDELKAAIEQPEPETGEFEVDRTPSREPRTSLGADTLHSLNNQLHKVPEGFTLHRKLGPQLERRRKTFEEEGTVDWAHAEALALASLLQQSVPVRLTGQDTERGTFSQRHLVLHDAETGKRHVPIQCLTKAQAPFELHNSPLSEIGCLGFEYGYSAHAPETLVLWEAQFGDFVNAAQVVVDQFLVSGLSKWGIASRLTLLLPHGYEGSGPEHSSARIERFISLASEGNIRIANCTTPGQYFHLLRRQALVKKRRPLIVMTPKSLLRHAAAVSRLEELTEGSFQPVLDDPSLAGDREGVTRLVLCSGKVYYDLSQHEQRARQEHVAIGRVELLYPFAANELQALMSSYPSLDSVVWAQEEPRNMGARAVMEARVRSILPDGVEYEYVGRPLRASPGEGYPPAHLAMQSRIVRAALDLTEPRGEGAEESALRTTTHSGTGS
ncbi:MAG: multifunctional oxoglutarate decarboxylase/oxoglutarate dehydrogenase thiamine pyrophosphate-binding subunit/dihydrolipoyllysine-residue succinyltransferase subunit [Thermoleophilaceae bacterium]